MNLLLLALLACGDKDDSGTDGGTDGGADGGTDGGADGGTDGGTDVGAVVSGQVVNPDGSGANVQMRLCADLCRSIMTDAQGYFEYTQVEPDHYALEAVNLADQKNVSTPLDLLTVSTDEVVALASPMIIYPFEIVQDIGDEPTSLLLDGGLTVMADPSVMTASEAYSPFLESGDSEYVASVRIQPDSLGLPLEEVQGAVLAAWYMGRVSVSLSPPWAFELDNSMGLEEGDKISIVAADVDAKVWRSGGTATVVDGKIVSDDGSGIPILSTVLFLTE